MAFQERSTPARTGRRGDFVGRGWSFPVRIGSHGGLALVGGTEEIDNSIRLILETAPGERVMRPDFGCAMWDQVFELPDAGTLGLIAQAVREAIGRWEPRVDISEVAAEAVDGEGGQRVDISIHYIVRATNDRRNLVHPFYTIPSERAVDHQALLDAMPVSSPTNLQNNFPGSAGGNKPLARSEATNRKATP